MYDNRAVVGLRFSAKMENERSQVFELSYEDEGDDGSSYTSMLGATRYHGGQHCCLIESKSPVCMCVCMGA